MDKKYLFEAFTILSDLTFSQDPVQLVKYIKKRLDSNDAKVICLATNTNISPERYYYLRRGHGTSILVKRSFSMLNNVLTKT